MIKHVLSDGREVDSVDGLVIPAYKSAASAVYQIVAEFARKQTEAIRSKEESNADIETTAETA